jgi:viologen exporter family transport system permease protein
VASRYLRMGLAQVRAQAQYRASFVMDGVGGLVFTALETGTVFVLFAVRRELGGFGWREVLLIVALAACAFHIADMVAGNLRLDYFVRTGLFDAVLIRPMSALGQLMTMDFAPRRMGRVLQGIALYAVALSVSGIPWTPARVLLAVLAPLAAVVFFGSVFVSGATVAFWWIESGELSNAFTFGGRDFTSYPPTVYGDWFRKLFAFGLGFAFVAYLPALALLGRKDPLGTPDWLQWCSPVTALLAALVAFLLWRTGIRHYRSTGS